MLKHDSLILRPGDAQSAAAGAAAAGDDADFCVFLTGLIFVFFSFSLSF